MGRNIIRGLVFLVWGGIQTSSFAQTAPDNMPRVCLNTNNPSITLLNDPTTLRVQRFGSSSFQDEFCTAPAEELRLSIDNTRPGIGRGGFILNPSSAFSADSIDINKANLVPLISVPPSVQGKVWIVDVRERQSGGWNVQCKSIEIVRQKDFQAQLTICTPSSGVLEIFPTDQFRNVNVGFALFGRSGNTPLNISLNRNQLSSQEISFPTGFNVSTAGSLQIIPTYLKSDNRLMGNCPLQQVQVRSLGTQLVPRIVELDRRNNPNEVVLEVRNINPEASFSVDRGPITGGRQQVLDNQKGPKVTVPIGNQENACFSVSVAPVCRNTAPITSNVVCSTWLEGEIASESGSTLSVNLNWRKSVPKPIFDQWILKNNVRFVFVNPILGLLNGLSATCSDASFQYSVEQTYQESSFNVKVFSNTLDLDPKTSLRAPNEKLWVSLSEFTSPSVEVYLADAFSINQRLNLYLEKKNANGAFDLLTSNFDQSFEVDVAADPAGAHCFRFGRAICGVKSPPSEEFCVIQNTLGEDYQFNWTAFTGAPEGIQPVYYIQFTNKETDPTFQSPDVLAPTQDLTGSLKAMFSQQPSWSQFLVRVFTQQTTVSGRNAYSYPVEVIRPLALHLPNAFSPNGDNINDFFRIENAFSGSGFMRIFNRLGQIIYYTEDLSTGWDGTTGKNIRLPTGMYQFEVEVTNNEGQVWRRVGSVFLVR